MALDDLASADDLSARGVDVSNAALVSAMLAAASEAVRDAAGCPISATTQTVALEAPSGAHLTLPSQPVTDVVAVLIDGSLVTDWRLASGALWRPGGWRSCGRPRLVEVTYTSGLETVPADIVDLVCQFAIAGINNAGEGSRAGLAYESVDDYRVGFQQGEHATASPMEVPARTRLWLRQRFGGGAYVVGSL